MRPLHTGFAVSVDLVVLTVVKGTLCALLFTRDSQPYQGRPALPGNFVAHDEDLASAAWRRLNAETGLSSTQVHLEQLASYGSIDRDPRGRVVTIGYLALLPSASIPRQKPSGAVARWNPVEPLLEEATALAFDHHKILTDGVERARAKLEYSSLAAEFCPPQFTIATLRSAQFSPESHRNPGLRYSDEPLHGWRTRSPRASVHERPGDQPPSAAAAPLKMFHVEHQTQTLSLTDPSATPDRRRCSAIACPSVKDAT